MIHMSLRRTLVVAAVATFSSVCPASVTHAQRAPGPIRTVLLQHDTTAPGYEAVLVQVEIPVGGREGRHTHPGLVMVHVEQGALTLDYEGRPTTDYRAGDSFFLEAGKVHEGINKGNVPVKAIATFVVQKGASLTTPVPAAGR
jgi:quercetin dioxygenase-like cupin family protein